MRISFDIKFRSQIESGEYKVVPWRAVDAFIHDYDYTEDSIIQIRKK